MRYSIDKADPGFQAHETLLKRGAKLKVFFRGVEQQDCKTADDVEGIIIKLFKNHKGQYMTERGKLITIKLQGKVTFEIVEKQNATI